MKLFRRLGMTAALLMLTASAQAKVQTQEIKYGIGGTEHIGFLAYDDASDAKRPGILIAPEWIGVNDYSRGRAKQLAEMGYVAFVHDPYGGGKNAADPKQAAEWSGVLKANRPELRKRVNAGLAELRKQERVDGSKIAAIGYCFGGTSVLELARSGADVAGVVSFHGNLATTMPVKAGDVKAKVLVCHGAIDPIVPPEEVAAFQKEMQEAKVDWQLISYGNAVHSFTNPAAKGTTPGVKYDEKADQRSWAAMKQFFQELFGVSQAGAGVDLTGSGVFTDMKDAKQIVFVCDATGGMINKLGDLKGELTKVIAKLDANKSFNVIFFTDGGKYHILWRDDLRPATALNKRDAYSFFEDVTPTGTTDPLPALEAAFKFKPELVHFVAEGAFDSFKTYAEIAAAIEQSKTGSTARLNTVLYKTYDKGAEAMLKKIARDSGGSYVYVADAR